MKKLEKFTLYKMENSQYILLIDNKKNTYLKFSERQTKYNIRVKSGKKEWFLDSTDSYQLTTRKKLIKISSISQSEIDTLLRFLVKTAGNLYLLSEVSSQENDYIPPSGKIVSKEELENMLDASLDMWLTSGRFNAKFEKQLSTFLNIPYVLTVNSGSSANLLAITALTSYKLGEKRLKQGDEVITLAAGFPTTIAPIIQNGLIPVFVDIEIGTYNIKIKELESAISKKTKAIFIAHTLGNPFDIDAIRKFAKKYNLWVIEDNCDALGSQYRNQYTGTFGDISTFSFYPAHHITMGEGGAVATKNAELYKILLSLRDWGRDCWCPPGKDNTCGKRFSQQFGTLPMGYDHKYVYSHLGYNLKLTDWQASIGLAQLKKLPLFIKKRRSNFNFLLEGLQPLKKYFYFPRWSENAEPSWFGFILTLKEGINKIEFIKYLEQNKVGTRNLFAGNILRQPVFTNGEFKIRIKNSPLLISSKLTEKNLLLLPNTDFSMRQTFWIGLWPGLTKKNITSIIKKFHQYFR